MRDCSRTSRQQTRIRLSPRPPGEHIARAPHSEPPSCRGIRIINIIRCYVRSICHRFPLCPDESAAGRELAAVAGLHPALCQPRTGLRNWGPNFPNCSAPVPPRIPASRFKGHYPHPPLEAQCRAHKLGRPAPYGTGRLTDAAQCPRPDLRACETASTISPPRHLRPSVSATSTGINRPEGKTRV